MTWTLVNSTLELSMTSGVLTYGDVVMPISTRIRATDLSATSSVQAGLKAVPDPVDDSDVACTARYVEGNKFVPIKSDVFANGIDSENLAGQWSCATVSSSDEQLAFSLGLDGSGLVIIDSGSDASLTPMQISSWQLNERTVNVTVGDGTTVSLELTSHNGDNFAAVVGVDGGDVNSHDCALKSLKLNEADSSSVVPAAMLDASAATVTYRFFDSSLPPDFHLSYTLRVDSDSSILTHDSYGDFLDEQVQSTDIDKLEELLGLLSMSDLSESPVEDQAGCTGGPTYNLKVQDDSDVVVREIGFYVCEFGKDEAAELRSIVDPILSLFDLSDPRYR